MSDSIIVKVSNRNNSKITHKSLLLKHAVDIKMAFVGTTDVRRDAKIQLLTDFIDGDVTARQKPDKSQFSMLTRFTVYPVY